MSDYWPTILELTSPLMITAVSSVLDLLTIEYMADFHKWYEHDFCDSSTVILGDNEVWIEIQIDVRNLDTEEAQITIRLESKAYESAHNMITQHTNQEGRKDLIKFCTDIAESACAEGFRLRFDNKILPPLNISEFVRILKSIDEDPGLINGLAISSVHWPEINSYWLEWNTLDNYYIKDFF